MRSQISDKSKIQNPKSQRPKPNDLRPNRASRHLASALGVTRTFRADLFTRQTRAARALQRLCAWDCLGVAHARRNDCHLYLSLRGHLRRTLWRQPVTLGLCSLSLLRVTSLDHVSG